MVNEQPTRVIGVSSTFLDLVISSKPELVKSTLTLELGISDHMLVFASVVTRVKRPPPKITHARTFKRFDCGEFKRDIEWSVCSVCSGPFALYLTIQMTITGRGFTCFMISVSATLHLGRLKSDDIPCLG